MRSNNVVVFGIVACIIANVALNYSLNCTTTLMSYIRDDFGIDSTMAIWASSVQFIGSLGFVGIAKLLMNKMNKKKALLIGVGGVTFTSFGIMFVDSATIFVILRFITGIAIAFIYVSCTALLTDLSTIENRDFIMSLNSGSSCLGTLLGISSKLFVDLGLDWKVAFIPVAILCVISIVLLYRVEDNFPLSPSNIDYLAQGLFIIGMSLLLNGAMTLGSKYGIYVLLAGVAFLVIGTVHGRVKKSSVLGLGLLVRNRTFAVTISMTFIFYFVHMAIISSCSFYLQVTSLSDALLFAVYINIVCAAVQMISSPIFGKISCRIDKRILPVASMIVTVIMSALCIIRLEESNAYLIIMILSVVSGIASAAFMGPNSSRVMSSVTVDDRPSASALLVFVKQSSKVIGSLLFVELTLAVHKATELEAYTMAVQLLGAICVVLGLVGTYLSFKSPKEYE